MRRKPRRAGALYLALAVLLSVFFMTGGCASQPVPGATPKPAPTLIPTRTPRPKPTLPSQRPKTPPPTPEPTPTPSPTPEPLPEGDFSLTFPNEDTGVHAEQSYQSDDIRIAISSAKKDGAEYFVADIWIRKIDFLQTAFAKDEFSRKGRERLLKIMERKDAILAISGDYYGARPNGVVIRNGESYRDKPLYDVLALYKNGEMKTFLNDEWDQEREMNNGVLHAWGFGPMLLDEDAQPMEEFSGIEYHRHNPRAAIGYYEPGHYCFVLVDGRRDDSKGMLLAELSALFYELGCKKAYNLDGGQTAILAFEGEFVNIPFKGGRSQTDIIYVGLPEEEDGTG